MLMPLYKHEYSHQPLEKQFIPLLSCEESRGTGLLELSKVIDLMFFHVGAMESINNSLIYTNILVQELLVFASQVEQGICHLGVGHELAEVLF